MFETIKNEIVVFTSQVFDVLTHTGDYARPVAYTALALTLITSLALLWMMLRFRGKRAVDIAITFREIAFACVIARIFVGLAFDVQLAAWGVACYVFLFVSCVAVLYFSVKEHWFPSQG